LGLLGGAAVTIAAGRPWATLRVRVAGLPASHVSVTGTEVLPVVSALGALVLAGAVVTVATRGVARRVCGLVVACAGVVVVVAVANAEPALAALLQDRLVGAAGRPDPEAGTAASAWRWLCAAGGVAAALFGLVVSWRESAWPGMGARYDAPSAPRRGVGEHDSDLWRALDRGEDPTRSALGDPER
jgi:hypothetical protein